MWMMGQSGIRDLHGWVIVLNGHGPVGDKAGTNWASKLVFAMHRSEDLEPNPSFPSNLSY